MSSLSNQRLHKRIHPSATSYYKGKIFYEKILKLNPESMEILNMAIQLVRFIAQDDSISDSKCMEMIAADFLSGPMSPPDINAIKKKMQPDVSALFRLK